MKLYAKIIDENTKRCQVGTGTNSEFYESIGMTEMDVEQDFFGNWYVAGYAPQPTIDEQNEKIRQQRQERYEVESDPLRLDYDEALARGEEQAEQLKTDWLASKDKIREELPYIEGTHEQKENDGSDTADGG